MPRNYSISGNATNTQSSTLPLFTVISTANVRPEIYSFTLSSDAAPADHIAKYIFQRCSTAGTPGSSITPVALDSVADEPAPVVTSGLAVFSAGPTLTANKIAYQVAVHQRIPYRWDCKDGKEIVLPATAANGIAVLPTVVDSAFNTVFSLQYRE